MGGPGATPYDLRIWGTGLTIFISFSEFQNILATVVKARQITPEYALDVWERVAGILVENECEPSPGKVIDLVAQYGITAYDGQFIALAMEMGILCLTEDGELQSKFPRVVVSMNDFLKSPAIGSVRERRGVDRRSRT